MLKILTRLTGTISVFSIIFSSYCLELNESLRTVPLNDTELITLTPEQLKKGKRLFNNNCSICHLGGITKTNPNIALDSESLKLATPSLNNVQNLVKYLENPTTFDGMESIAEIHPSIKSADIFPKMRNLTNEDLTSIAGHILIQPKILGEKWGHGKVYY